ncbi:MAG: hypothetical protein E6I80_16330 [Chloroflexi bacterium]|nr:MAG: hypothetical protein E6I80_16330 [Chloroflexota bacterium]
MKHLGLAAHDGLNVDSQNRVWFDEEFANKLADTFQRANQSLWGTASDGQTWGGDANSRNAV